MTESYVTAKIHDALKATNDDKADAVKLLVTWAIRDQTLLLGLAKPHLKDLATSMVEQELRAARSKHKGAGPASEKETGRETAFFFPDGKGEKRHPLKVPPPKTSERQASVMHQLVAAFKTKK